MSQTGDRFPALASIPPIGLDEMDSIKLMNRVDTKFVTSVDVLSRILEMAAGQYRVLVTEGQRLSAYDTLYFDTADRSMYLAHQNGHLTRQKVRVRTYMNSGTTFLEIKRKNNRGRTKKKRMEIPREEFTDFSSDAEAAAFLAEKSWFEASQLSPATYTRFRRITLVNNAKTERLTIDMELNFENARTGLSASLPDAVIIELKQDGLCWSPMREILAELRVKPLRVSKYCIGTALTDPEIKKSRFLLKIRKIEKIIGTKLIDR